MIEQRFLKNAVNLGNIFSKDPSTKVGCLIFDPQDRSVISRGYNGMPRGFSDNNPETLERPLKYSYWEHAERNAIYNEVLSYLSGSIAIITGLFDTSCTRAFIIGGAKVICMPEKFKKEFETSVQCRILKDANVSVLYCTEFSILDENNILTDRQISAMLKNFKYLEGLKNVAKDPYVVSCAFFTPDTLVEITQGYSDLVRGAVEEASRYELPLREYWVEGPVRNAVYNLVRKKGIFKEKIAAVSATSCFECARGLINCGIAEIIAVAPSEDMQQRWAENFNQTRKMCEEIGINLVEIPLEELLNE